MTLNTTASTEWPRDRIAAMSTGDLLAIVRSTRADGKFAIQVGFAKEELENRFQFDGDDAAGEFER